MTERSFRHEERLTFPACDKPPRIPSGPSCEFLQAENLEQQSDLLSTGAVVPLEKSEERSRHDSSNESHDHQHRENTQGKYT